MSEYLSTSWDLGDIQAEFAGHDLGSGRAEIQLLVQAQNMRRDQLHPMQQRIVRQLECGVQLELNSADPLLDYWETIAPNGLALSNASADCFSNGGTLTLYSMDPSRKGLVMERAFFQSFKQNDGDFLKTGKTSVSFLCEAASSTGRIFHRIAAGSLPSGMTLRAMPDITVLTAQLASELQTQLQCPVVVSGYTCSQNSSFQCLLRLVRCTSWERHAPREFCFQLIARYTPEMQQTAEKKLTEAANFLHGFCTPSGTIPVLAAQVQQLELDKTVAHSGQVMKESVLELLMITR